VFVPVYLVMASWERPTRGIDSRRSSSAASVVAALLLATNGIFAVLAHAVGGRTRKFGIRVALGANARRVLWHMLREGMAFPVAGMLVGVAASLATRLLQSSLYELTVGAARVRRDDGPPLVVAAAACLVPSAAANRVDPTEALRAE
jgi:putative ABC transport system permease protein